MQFSSKLRHLWRRPLCAVLLIFSIQECFTQVVSDSFIKKSDSLIIKSPKTYQEINAALELEQNDTVLMRFFANNAADRKYFVGQSFALNQLGKRYLDISEFSKSLALYQRALKAAEEANNIEFEVHSLNMISVILRRTDAIKSSLDYSQKTLMLAETVEKPSNELKRSMMVAMNAIGNIYQILEQYDLAIAQFGTSMEAAREMESESGLAINYQNIGESYEAKGMLAEAMENFQTALVYNERINSERGRIMCNYNIAHVLVHQGHPKEALTLLENTLSPAETLDDKTILSTILINIGWAMIDLNRYVDARSKLVIGLKMAEHYKLHSEISEANKFLSDLSAKEGDFEKALEYHKTSLRYEQIVSNDRNRRYVADVISRHDSERRSNENAALAVENQNYKVQLRKNQTILLVSGIALALLAGIFYILYRQYQLKSEKKVLTLEQSMLRSQMNPHFLFNSLNSIKLYIINNEQKNAVHYLNKFSKLVRKILEASALKEIPLAEELETVELYMNIEDIRFSNELDFKIKVDENIDVHQVKIPSLILQPFLENALWHGLSSKEGLKKIQLHISRDGSEYIYISITDNGVGREAAQIIKEGKVLKRKSMGIDITKERLANFSRDYQNSFEVEMLDLYDDQGTATGTRVVLRIPTI